MLHNQCANIFKSAVWNVFIFPWVITLITCDRQLDWIAPVSWRMSIPSQSSSTLVGSRVSCSYLSDGDSLLWLQGVGSSRFPFILPLIITSLLDLTPYSDGLSWEELEPVGLKLHNWFTANCGHQGRSVTVSLVMTAAAVRRPWLALLPQLWFCPGFICAIKCRMTFVLMPMLLPLIWTELSPFQRLTHKGIITKTHHLSF